jgi:hypothetical protein
MRLSFSPDSVSQLMSDCLRRPGQGLAGRNDDRPWGFSLRSTIAEGTGRRYCIVVGGEINVRASAERDCSWMGEE